MLKVGLYMLKVNRVRKQLVYKSQHLTFHISFLKIVFRKLKGTSMVQFFKSLSFKFLQFL